MELVSLCIPSKGSWVVVICVRVCVCVCMWVCMCVHVFVCCNLLSLNSNIILLFALLCHRENRKLKITYLLCQSSPYLYLPTSGAGARLESWEKCLRDIYVRVSSVTAFTLTASVAFSLHVFNIVRRKTLEKLNLVEFVYIKCSL